MKTLILSALLALSALPQSNISVKPAPAAAKPPTQAMLKISLTDPAVKLSGSIASITLPTQIVNGSVLLYFFDSATLFQSSYGATTGLANPTGPSTVAVSLPQAPVTGDTLTLVWWTP